MPFTPGQQVRNRGAQTFGQASGLPGAVKYGPELRTDGLVTADAAAVSRGRRRVEKTEPPEIRVGLRRHRRQAIAFEDLETMFEPPFGARRSVVFVPRIEVQIEPRDD